MKTLANVHPGEILMEEFLKPMNVTAYKLSKSLGIPQIRISAILKGNRGITADTALRFSLYFENSAKLWLGLQDDYELEEAQRTMQKELKKIKKIEVYAA
jgi:addiction module HigA family antidote